MAVMGFILKFCDPCLARNPGIRQALQGVGSPFLVLEGDRAASIDFIKPGRGTMSVDFVITDAMLDDIIEKNGPGREIFAGIVT